MAWLATLGEVKVNWQTLSMKFMQQGQLVEVKGDLGFSRVLVSPQALMKMTEIEAVSMLWMIETETVKSNEEVQDNGKELGQQPQQLQAILEEFAAVFAEPKELPPSRDEDHRIPIKAGVDPVNVRPYRYPYLQKNEIEKQVFDMLNAGLIRPSKIPYSIPMILIKKKDGSWRFCIDYRALNMVTIPDKFPIPVIKSSLQSIFSVLVGYRTHLSYVRGFI